MKRLLLLLASFLLVFPFAATAGMNGGLVAYYPFNGTVQDESGNGNDGTVYGAVFVEGLVDEGLQFDGVDDYATIPNSNFVNTSTFTVALWWKFIAMNPNKGETLIEKRNGGGANSYNGNYIVQYASFASSPHTGPFLRVVIGDGSQEVECFKDNLELHDGQFYFIVATYDQSYLRLYLDGVKIAQFAATMTTNVGDGDIHLGSALTSGHYTNGIIDQLYLYNRAMSDTEITQRYNLQTHSDSDDDGVIDIWDQCPSTPPNSFIDNQGCPTLIGDIDGDGKIDLKEAINALRTVSGM